MTRERIVLNLIDDDGILALRAARWLREHPNQNDGVLAYGDSNDPPTFHVRRGKASVIVSELPRKGKS